MTTHEIKVYLANVFVYNDMLSFKKHSLELGNSMVVSDKSVELIQKLNLKPWNLNMLDIKKNMLEKNIE